jgi:hypothetical protein
MKVLLVGNLYGGDLGANYYFIMEKLLHGFARNGDCVHVFNDRYAARASNPFGSRKLGVKAANRQLLEVCRTYRPDLVLLGHCEIVRNETLEAVREAVPEVRIAYRNIDPIHDANNRARIHARVDSVDAIFTPTAGERLREFAGGRARVYFMPNPVDAAAEPLRQFEKTDLPVDLFFAISGVIRDRADPRVEMVEALRARLGDVRFEVLGIDRPSRRGAGYFDEIARAAMGLNFSRVNDHYLYSSNRMSQYQGCGLLTFTPRGKGFGALFSEDELPMFDGVDELVDKIRFYRGDDAARRRVAEAGWRRIHQLFDTARVARYIKQRALDLPLTDTLEWPTEAAKPL